MTLKTDIEQIATDSGLLHEIVHGGATDTVATDGGAVKSVAKAVADAEAAIIAGAESYLAQCEVQADDAEESADLSVSAKTAAETARDESVSAKNLALAAWASSMQPAETLPAISAMIHYGPVVATCDMDAALTDDPDFWRKTGWTSYAKETRSQGAWRGWLASESACRAISGATTGDYFGKTSDGKFYELSAGSGVVETFRGGSATYPAGRCKTVFEAARAVTYEQVGSVWQMWKVWKTTAGYSLHSGTITSAAFANGKLFVGMSAQEIEIDFYADTAHKRDGTNYTQNSNGLGAANTAGTWRVISTAALVNAIVSSVAATVLPGAQVDPASNMRKPYVAYATDGSGTYSVSVIMPNDTVVNVGSDSTGTCVDVGFVGRNLRAVRSDGTVYYWNDVTRLTTGQSPDATFSASSTPALLGTVSKAARNAFGSSLGVTLVQRNEANPAASMVARISKDYPGMWQTGLGRAWLCGSDTADRAQGNHPLTAVGTLTETQVGGVTMYSGWSSSVYREEAYSADWGAIGTGDFCVGGWAHGSVTAEYSALFSKSETGQTDSNSFGLKVSDSLGKVYAISEGTSKVPTTLSFVNGGLNCVFVYRSSGRLYMFVNGATEDLGAFTTDLTSAAHKCMLGRGGASNAEYAGGLKLAFWRFSATAPSADDIAKLYRDELALFQLGAVGTLAGSSSSVLAQSYDSTGLLHCVTSTHRSAHHGLVLVESEDISSYGTPTSISCRDGSVTVGFSSGATYSQPAVSLRAIEGSCERVNQRIYGKDETTVATASQTIFPVLAQGYKARAVYSDGIKIREHTAGNSWSQNTTGHGRWTVTFLVGRSADAVITIETELE